MGEIVPVAQKHKNIETALADPKMRAQLQSALARVGVTPDRMCRWFMTALRNQPKLYKCDLDTLFGCLIQSAQLGLDPSGVTGEAYLVPYKTKATFIPGYRGLLKLARRSGDIQEVCADVVYEKDDFTYEQGLDSKLRHIPSEATDAGMLTHAYAYAKFTNGGRQFVVMTKAEVDGIRGQSAAGNSGPWVDHYPEMAKKTAFRRLAKWLPLHADDAAAVELDGQAEAGKPQTLPIVDIPVTVSDAQEDRSHGTPGVETPRTVEGRATERGAESPAAADGSSPSPPASSPADSARLDGPPDPDPSDMTEEQREFFGVDG